MDQQSPLKRETVQWYDVEIIKGTSCLVTHFFLPSEMALEDQFCNELDVGLHAGQVGYLKKSELEAGTAYKFRVAGINACGRGGWSDGFDLCKQSGKLPAKVISAIKSYNSDGTL